jgi:hypothetical protein
VGTRTYGETEARAEASAEAVGLFGDGFAATRSSRGAGGRPSSWRDPLRPIRAASGVPLPIGRRRAQAATNGGAQPTSSLAAADAADAGAGQTVSTSPDPGDEPFAGVLAEPGDLVHADHAAALLTRARSDASRVTGPTTAPASTISWGDEAAAGDPVRLTLDIVMGELRRPDHPRLQELPGGRWWLRDAGDLAGVSPPLSDRVEWAVYSLLSTSGGIAEGAFFARIAGMFRGHDTPDDDLVRACLESYRSREPSMDGLLRTDDPLQARFEEHGALVGLLTEFGHRLGLRCWISRREQRRLFNGRPLGELLSEAEQRVYLPLVHPGDGEALEAVDCMWYVRGKASFVFEVEWTAMLHEAVLQRGARIPTTDTLVRFLVIPPERTELVRLKLARSPLLQQRVDEDNWHFVKSDHLRRFLTSDDADLDGLAPLLGLDPAIERRGEQLPLFG